MNERIKQIAIETDAWCDQNVALDDPWYNDIWEEKFAGAIIAECIKACQDIADDAHKQKNSSFLTADGKQLYNGVWGGAMNCANAISHKFSGANDE